MGGDASTAYLSPETPRPREISRRVIRRQDIPIHHLFTVGGARLFFFFCCNRYAVAALALRLWQTTAATVYTPSQNGGPNPCPAGSGPSSWAQYSTTNTNRIDASGLSFSYDAAGNVKSDGINSYLYDGEGRICAVQQSVSGLITNTQYLFDAEGRRVAKGSISSFSCDTTANGFTATAVYVLGPDGEQMTEMAANSSGGWQWAHTNVFAPGLTATYDADLTGQSEGALYFHLSDWLGTRRQQTDYVGNPVLNFTGLPYGDGLATVPVSNTDVSDATEHHFTGKERDTESGNDYFEARYFGSSMGRFLSPDPASATPLHLLNPQRWNMYSYGLNNPLSFTDAGGRDAAAVNFSKEIAIVGHQGIMSVHPDGTVVYARFGPQGGDRPWGPGQVQSFPLNSKVQFDSSGQPTTDSLNAVKQELSTSNLSPEQGQDPSSIRLNYFKTTDAETANLDQWIKQQQDASNRGQAHYYNVTSTNCTWFCARGLVAAGVLDQNQANHASPAPNGFQWQLLELQSRQPCARTAATDSQGNTTGWSGCQ